MLKWEPRIATGRLSAQIDVKNRWFQWETRANSGTALLDWVTNKVYWHLQTVKFGKQDKQRWGKITANTLSKIRGWPEVKV